MQEIKELVSSQEKNQGMEKVEGKDSRGKNFLVPHGYRVIVAEDEFRYTGMIAIPDTAKRRPTTGVIIAIPPDHVEELGHLDGKRVVYAQFSGTLVQFKNRPAYRILAIEEILAFVTKTEEELVLEETNA